MPATISRHQTTVYVLRYWTGPEKTDWMDALFLVGFAMWAVANGDDVSAWAGLWERFRVGSPRAIALLMAGGAGLVWMVGNVLAESPWRVLPCTDRQQRALSVIFRILGATGGVAWWTLLFALILGGQALTEPTAQGALASLAWFVWRDVWLLSDLIAALLPPEE